MEDNEFPCLIRGLKIVHEPLVLGVSLPQNVLREEGHVENDEVRLSVVERKIQFRGRSLLLMDLKGGVVGELME